MELTIISLWLLAISHFVYGHTVFEEAEREKTMHPSFIGFQNEKDISIENADFWISDAQERLQRKVEVTRIENVAKNVIFYLGDGMSIHTITAARILKGQEVDHFQYGEEAELYIDTFPFTGTSKTFCSDAQVADSACSATAYLCGSKGNDGTIGVTPDVRQGDCAGQANKKNQVSSALAWAQAAGKSTGIVTTARVTHASPAGAFSHIAHRDWENDGRVKRDGGDPQICEDIAKQLITREPGININVILGGGRNQFTPNTTADIEFPKVTGYREDGTNLINSWISMKSSNRARYVSGRDQLLQINTEETDYLLGLFDPSHVAYLDQQADNNDPTLEEMTKIAIQILSKNPNGFFLFVEGGRIDHAHHDNYVQRALWETIEFDKAVKLGDNMTSDSDTLIVVTSDHAHVMAFAGYPPRGNPILEFSPLYLTTNLQPYHTLHYGNGPGPSMYENGKRKNIWRDHFYNWTYQVPSPIPLAYETHGGDDVLIFAKGPYAHYYEGTHDQSYIPHVIGYAACIGSGAQSQYCPPQTSTTPDNNNASSYVISGMSIGILVFLVLIANNY